MHIDKLLQELLIEGRAALAQKNSVAERREAEKREAAALAFEYARRKAVELFGLNVETIVYPKEVPLELDVSPNSNPHMEFYVCPFGFGKVFVKLLAKCVAPNARILTWDWCKVDPWTFYVESNFTKLSSGVVGKGFHTTNSFPEALALCEKEAPNFKKCWQTPMAENPPNPTNPTETLVAALTAWRDSSAKKE